KLKVGGLLALLLITTSCGQGFQPSSELKSVGSASCVSCGDGGLVTDPWEKVDVESIMPTNEIFGVSKIVEIDKVNSLILVNIPLPPVIGGIFGGSIPGYPIPQLPGATLGIVQNGLNYALQLSVPLRYVVKGVAFTETGLPNGDPLPGVPD